MAVRGGQPYRIEAAQPSPPWVLNGRRAERLAYFSFLARCELQERLDLRPHHYFVGT